MHLRAEDALQVWSFVWKDRWVPIGIKASTTDPCDSRSHCVFFWRCTVNSLDGAFGSKNGALTFAHGNLLAEETVPAAFKLHADRLLVQALEGPLTASHLPREAFAVGSRCLLSILPLVFPILTRRSAWLRRWWCVGTAVRHARGWPSCRWRHAICPSVLFHGRIAAHLLAHALGFNCPHTASHSVVRNAIGVRGRALSVVVHSANAAMAAREHHDCDDIDGMELQDEDGDGRTLESHWWRCHARDEWMAPIGGAGCCRGSAPH
ncbi:surface protease GP63 [Trypanosoma cruzi]|nr:surface protease GP63 [Trypanosoma cruzi]